MEWIICKACRAVTTGTAQEIPWTSVESLHCPKLFYILHHQTYRDFREGMQSGCIVCTWLWNKQPLPRTLDGAQDETRGFGIYCNSQGSGRISFHVIIPWASDFEYKDLLMTVFISDPDIYGHRPLPMDVMLASPWDNIHPIIGSDQSLKQLKSWISDCDQNHRFCHHLDSIHFFPTRVIDVSNIDQGTVVLQDQSSIISTDFDRPPGLESHSAPPYWTLSHRWGTGSIIKLLEGNEDQFKKGVAISHLPIVFQDAMRVVHRLGHRYIWIDSLCIIQDSPDDWQKEAKSMAKIYRNCFCNISAISASSDTTRGLFGSRQINPRLLFPFPLDVKDGHQPTIWNEEMWKDEIENAPLCSRGWVVQERFLASRVVHFGLNQIYWECLEATHCEADFNGQLDLVHNIDITSVGKQSVYKKSLLALLEISALVSESGIDRTRPGWEDRGGNWHSFKRLRLCWRDMIQTYSSCNLTQESDKFIAMAGIALLFQQVLVDRYLAGLWQRSLHVDLLWTTNASKGVHVHRTDAFAPSWSWASVCGGRVDIYAHTRFGGDPESLIKFCGARIEPQPSSGDPMGVIESAEVDIECCLLYYRWCGLSRKLEVFSDKSRRLPILDDDKIISIKMGLDTTNLQERFDKEALIEGICVPIARAREAYGAGWIRFKLVECVAGNKFCRLGMLDMSKWGIYYSEDNLQRGIITLV
ncbi:HET-domain-containing protein [Aspergillus sclerotiicarbonarius CBS 121057]|uniref:HET-domain-containing protein n=1 Tax=Aspergillus sclerotiicarbonarius (strain CBS 121057 / IBT 28362) TaxID=1448318 RepID=A0A319E193_ASPSB|nr:HET-domain-containing protein [Aspergillus sclerotiicarbonarius CBS 121057]